MEKTAMNYINLYNEKGQKHGYWEHHHPNGQLESKGYYLNNLKNGTWVHYTENGLYAWTGRYLNSDCKEIRKNFSYIEITMDEIANKFGISVEQLKITKK